MAALFGFLDFVCIIVIILSVISLVISIIRHRRIKKIVAVLLSSTIILIIATWTSVTYFPYEVTEAPTTEAPTTEAPTTEAPTTEAPTTEAPTTEAPTTEAPTTEPPTTEAPTTEAPTTEPPTTEAPTTEPPTTEPPTTEPPTTEAESEEEFKASCQVLGYKKLLRTPDEYISQRIVVEAKVKQVISAGWFDDSSYYRVQTDNKGSGYYYDDEYIVYDKRESNSMKVLEDDVIKIYGIFIGTQDMTRAITRTKEEVPEIEAYYIELISE